MDKHLKASTSYHIMDCSPNETDKKQGSRPGQVITDCLGISEIIKKIMQNLSTKELLQLSLVNKQWNYEARSLMRNRGNLTANIRKKYRLSNPLRAFVMDLERMKEMKNVVPLSGLTFSVGDWNLVDLVGLEEPLSEVLDPVVKDIVDHLNWKHLSVTFLWNYNKRENSSDLLLVQKILQSVCPVLEELSLGVRKDLKESVQQLLHCCCFPRLKILKLKEETLMTTTDFTLDANMTKALVSRAPNLEILFTQSQVDLTRNLLEGSSAMHVTDYAYTPGLHEIPEAVVGQLRLQRLALVELSWEFKAEKFNRITTMLLQTSRLTLTSVQIHAIYLLPLMQYGICLENVTNLELHLDYVRLESIQPNILRLVKSFDFTHHFPKVTAVKLNWPLSYELISAAVNKIVEQGYAPLVEPTPERAVNIKTLRLHWSSGRPTDLENESGRFLAQMFPEVQKLDIQANEVSFGSIWDSWPDLQELEVTIDTFSLGKNFDSEFLGIFPEEVTVLREKDEEFLRNVNIVPVMPAITCMKGLRTLDLAFEKHFPYSTFRSDETYMFSKVAGLIAFKRCPSLTVTLRTFNTTRVTHLQPFACIVSTERRVEMAMSS